MFVFNMNQIKLSFLFTLIVFISFGSEDTLKSNNSSKVEYVALDIEENEDYSSFELLKRSVDDYNIFFTGENHLFRNSNYKLQLKMLKFLHQNRGVKHLLLEFGFSRGYLVNNYVQTGDSTLFKVLDDYSFDEYSKLYKGIRAYNETLHDTDKIVVHGIDLERSYLTSVKLLNLMLPKDKIAHDSIELNIEALKSLMGYNDNRFDSKETDVKSSNYGSGLNYNFASYSEYNTMKVILRNYKEHQNHYRSYLSNNFKVFDKVMRGLQAEVQRQSFEIEQTFHAKIYRETYMFNEFVELVDSLDGERFFSQFGRCHTATEEQDDWCNFYHFKTLASRISNSNHPALKGKVCSIASYYPKNETLWYGNEESKGIRDLVKGLGMKDGDINLIKVPKDSSELEMKYFSKLSNKFQFIIINNNALIDDLNQNATEKDSEYLNEVYINFTAVAQVNYYNLDKLNTALNLNGVPNLDEFMVGYGGSLTVFENWFTYFSTSLTYVPKTTFIINDSTKFSLRSWHNKYVWGEEITKGTVFNLGMYGGFGFSKMKMDIESTGSSTLNDGFFQSSEPNIMKYENFGLLLDVGTDIRLNLSIFTLSLNLGYQLDVSKKYWRLNGDISKASPKTSFSSPYASLKLGFGLK